MLQGQFWYEYEGYKIKVNSVRSDECVDNALWQWSVYKDDELLYTHPDLDVLPVMSHAGAKMYIDRLTAQQTVSRQQPNDDISTECSLAEKAFKEIQQEVDKNLLRDLHISISFCKNREKFCFGNKCYGCAFGQPNTDGEYCCTEQMLCKFIGENGKPDLNKATEFYEKHCELLNTQEEKIK